MMSIEPQIRMRMSMSLICQVCRYSLDTRNNFDALALGYKSKYNICKCGRQIPNPECDDTNYRRRWRYWNKKVNFCTWD